MKSVEGHLGGRLTDWLSSYWANRLSSWCQALVELWADLFDETDETFFADFFSLAYFFAGKEHSQMYPEQFQSVFLLKLSLFLEKLILLSFLLNSGIFCQQFRVLKHSIGGHALIDQLFDMFIDDMGSYYFCSFLPGHGSDFIDESFDFDGSVVLYLGCVFVEDEDFSETDSASVEDINLIS